MNTTYATRRAQGLCSRCGKVPPMEGKKICSACQEGQTTAARLRNERRRDSGRCYRCCKPLPENSEFGACPDCRAAMLKRYPSIGQRQYRDKTKDEVFQNYGGYICTCCGETEKKVLTIDHVEGGGCQHRKKISKSGSGIYIYLKREGFPSGYQVLCYNCNVGKYRNGGVCPIHQNKLDGADIFTTSSKT